MFNKTEENINTMTRLEIIFGDEKYNIRNEKNSVYKINSRLDSIEKKLIEPKVIGIEVIHKVTQREKRLKITREVLQKSTPTYSLGSKRTCMLVPERPEKDLILHP
jgi:hypothetical protein